MGSRHAFELTDDVSTPASTPASHWQVPLTGDMPVAPLLPPDADVRHEALSERDLAVIAEFRAWEKRGQPEVEFPHDNAASKLFERVQTWTVPTCRGSFSLGPAGHAIRLLLVAIPVLWVVISARLKLGGERAYFDGCVNATSPAAAALPVERLPRLPISTCLACNGNVTHVWLAADQARLVEIYWVGLVTYHLICFILGRLISLRAFALTLLARGVRVKSMLWSTRTLVSLTLSVACITYFCHVVVNVRVSLGRNVDLGMDRGAGAPHTCAGDVVGTLKPVFEPSNPAYQPQSLNVFQYLRAWGTLAFPFAIAMWSMITIAHRPATAVDLGSVAAVPPVMESLGGRVQYAVDGRVLLQSLDRCVAHMRLFRRAWGGGCMFALSLGEAVVWVLYGYEFVSGVEASASLRRPNAPKPRLSRQERHVRAAARLHSVLLFDLVREQRLERAEPAGEGYETLMPLAISRRMEV